MANFGCAIFQTHSCRKCKQWRELVMLLLGKGLISAIFSNVLSSPNLWWNQVETSIGLQARCHSDSLVIEGVVFFTLLYHSSPYPYHHFFLILTNPLFSLPSIIHTTNDSLHLSYPLNLSPCPISPSFIRSPNPLISLSPLSLPFQPSYRCFFFSNGSESTKFIMVGGIRFISEVVDVEDRLIIEIYTSSLGAWEQFVRRYWCIPDLGIHHGGCAYLYTRGNSTCLEYILVSFLPSI